MAGCRAAALAWAAVLKYCASCRKVRRASFIQHKNALLSVLNAALPPQVESL